MRKIKFRGFTIDCLDNEWVYGDLIHYDTDETYIIPQNDRYLEITWDISDDDNRVDETTVGQFTGLEDKNGREIYEGDILKLIDEDGSEIIVCVIFINYIGGFVLKEHMRDIKYFRIEDFGERNREIIGNIFENKELLKTEQEL